MSPHISVAELYHENSKLSRELLPRLTAIATDASGLRGDYLRRRGAVSREYGTEGLAESAPWRAARSLLDSVSADGVDLFYAIDIRVIHADSVLSYEPASRLCRLLKELSRAERERLADALNLLDPLTRPAADPAFVFLVACFPRNEVLYGRRGYRRTLVEAGQLTGKMLDHASRAGHHCLIHHEFSDREAELIMEVDGVEHSIIVAIELT